MYADIIYRLAMGKILQGYNDDKIDKLIDKIFELVEDTVVNEDEWHDYMDFAVRVMKEVIDWIDERGVEENDSKR